MRASSSLLPYKYHYHILPLSLSEQKYSNFFYSSILTHQKKKTMGNCLVLEEKSVSVMKTDGKILEYKAPIQVHQILSEFSHHAISDKLPVVKHLHPNTELLQGKLYYLLPLPQPAKKKTTPKKKVRFAEDVVEKERRSSGAVRIKLVITKQELQAILAKEGVSVEDMMSQAKKEPIKILSFDRDEGGMDLKGRSPALESIPEVY